MSYAEKTKVTADGSKAEIERTLRKYGASGFGYMTQNNMSMVAFVMKGKQIRFAVSLPDFEDFARTPVRGTRRSPEEQQKEYDQACRAIWRSLLLIIKAKLEAVLAGITVFEEEFLAHFVLADGTTFGKWAVPQIEAAYKANQMPTALPFFGQEKTKK